MPMDERIKVVEKAPNSDDQHSPLRRQDVVSSSQWRTTNKELVAYALYYVGNNGLSGFVWGEELAWIATLFGSLTRQSTYRTSAVPKPVVPSHDLRREGGMHDPICWGTPLR